MIRRALIIFCLCCFGISIVYLLCSYPWMIYPTKSSPHELKCVYYAGQFANQPVVTIRHIVYGQYVDDSILQIENGIHCEEPQSYELPKLDDGYVEVTLKLIKDSNYCFTLPTCTAQDFYRKGLLIYLAEYDGISAQYVYLISGDDMTCYKRETRSGQWSVDSNVPAPKAIPHKNFTAYTAVYSGWKENKWMTKYN